MLSPEPDADRRFGSLLIVAWPYTTQVNTWWLLATAFPYYLMYMRDLRWAGYQRKAEFLRVYSLNLLLVPMHLLGSLKSLYHACTGKKSVFKETLADMRQSVQRHTGELL